MTAFVAWYLIITLLGWLTFPLVFRILPALADRGYSLARAAGLLIWAYAFWLCTSLGFTGNTVGGVLFGLLAPIALSVSSILVPRTAVAKLEALDPSFGQTSRLSDVTQWVRRNWRLIASIEILFLCAFAFMALIRAGNPTLDNAEKPMELMFINSILRSPGFPPHDGWLSGYAVSYYYFGYVMTAMLARLAGLTGSVAHNLMTALIFALAAIGAYGILFDLLAARTRSSNDGSSETPIRNSPIGLAFLSPLFLLLVSNLEGFLEVLHRAGIFWSGTPNFWTWLGIKELNEAPAQPLGWIPDRFWWWWRASRVISDYDLTGNFREVIDEFPFFSFLHADLHPHLLAIPFSLLATAIALNLFLGGSAGEFAIFGLHLKINRVAFFSACLTLGGLAFLNTWDILIGAALFVLAYVLLVVRMQGWSWARLRDAFALALPLGVLAVLLYAPFYLGFSSQAGGLLPNLTNPTRGAHLWVMFGPLFVPLLAYLIHLVGGRRRASRWMLSLLLVSLGTALLYAFSWGLGWLASSRELGFVQQYLDSQGTTSTAEFFRAAMSRRLSHLGGLLSMLVLLLPSIAFLTAIRGRDEPVFPDHLQADRQPPDATLKSTVESPRSGAEDHAGSFSLLLISIGCLLVIAPEFVFLRDQFASRLNTIFKFYYQAWLLWSLAAAFATAVLFQQLRGPVAWIFRSLMLVMLIVSLTYPVLALSNKTNGFKPAFGWTLDDFARIQRSNPDEAAAIVWLNSVPFGVLTEAVGGSYTGFGRISEYTGLPAVLGWPGHESQWRGTTSPQGTRQEDIALLYNTPNWESARGVLEKYDVRYVYVGGLERSTYAVQEEKFQRYLIQAFQQGNVTVYQVP